MFKRIKRIKRLDCVQEGGFRHFIAHLIGNIGPSRCYMLASHRWGRMVAEGFKAGIEKAQQEFNKPAAKLEEVTVEDRYKEELKKLHARIGDKGGLVAEMEGLEPQLAIGELKALNKLSDKEMKEYLKLHKQKKKIEKKQFLESIPAEYRDEIEKRFFDK